MYSVCLVAFVQQKQTTKQNKKIGDFFQACKSLRLDRLMLMYLTLQLQCNV